MTTLLDIHSKRDALLRQRAEAQAAEKARLDAETAAKRAIAETEAELARLETQELELRWQNAKVRNAELVEVNRQAVGELLTALDKLDIQAAIDRLAGAVERTFQAQQNHENQAYHEVVAPLANAAAHAAATAAGADQRKADHDAQIAYSTVERKRMAEFVPALGLGYALMGWIAGTEGADRQRKQGIAYVFVGEIYNPGKDYQPVAAFRAARQRGILRSTV